MKEELITFDTAKLAKEKGFDKRCPFEYVMRNQQEGFKLTKTSLTTIGTLHNYAPTQSLLQKWIWETQSIWVQSTPLFSSNECIGVSVVVSSWKFPPIRIGYEDFNVYEGLEAGLQEALNLI